ncbi:cysteine protease [Rhizoctonia solani]
MSKPSLSETKLLDDAQATLARAMQAEHAGQLDAAYHLYIECAKDFVHLATNSTRPQIRNAARTAGSRALGRADLIKNAKQGELRRVQRDPLSEEEQLHILKRSSRVNGINLPAWPSSIGQSFGSDDQSRSIFIDTDGAPQLSPAHSAALAGWKRPLAELPMVDLETPDEIVQDVSIANDLVPAYVYLLKPELLTDNPAISWHSALYILKRNKTFPLETRKGIIDELLPTAPDGRLICATTVKQAQLWPALLEKAYMKLMGGYDFPGSNSSIDLHAITSWIPEHMYLNGNDFQREKSWKRIYDGFINGKALLTLGTGETVTSEDRWKDILIAAHNYAIVGLEDDGTTQNLKVLNPWRRTDASQGSQPPEIWVLLTRHVLSKETKADFIALHHFSHTEAGGLPRADQVPNKIRIKDTPSDEIISLIAARDGSGPETGYTLSIYSHAKIEIEAITKVLGYIKTVSLIELVFANFLDLVQAKGNFTSKSAGGNASLPTFMNNPQYRVRIGNGTEGGSRGRVPVKLTVEGARTLPLNMKLVWSGGKRVSDVVAGDVILDSGAYNFGLACTEGEVQSGDYTLVLSSFRAGQQGEYALRVECDASVEISLLPPEGAGMFHKTVKGAWDAASAMGGPSSGKYEHNPTFEIAVSSPTQVSARLQIISKQQSSLPPPPALNLTLFERNPQGLPGKQVATSGAYSDAVSGVMLPDTALRPGIYLFVPSTYYPNVLSDFQILLYSTTNTLNPTRIR